jgi:hypothetical protein
LTSTLVGGEWSVSRPRRITSRERAPGTHLIGGWVGPRAGLDDVEMRKFLILPGLELRSLGFPVHSQSLSRLLLLLLLLLLFVALKLRCSESSFSWIARRTAASQVLVPRGHHINPSSPLTCSTTNLCLSQRVREPVIGCCRLETYRAHQVSGDVTNVAIQGLALPPVFKSGSPG